jgi:hypothetical protein
VIVARHHKVLGCNLIIDLDRVIQVNRFDDLTLKIHLSDVIVSTLTFERREHLVLVEADLARVLLGSTAGHATEPHRPDPPGRSTIDGEG